MNMKILVQGVGALGGYFGLRILEAGYDVSFFVREKRAQQLKEEGLRISSPEGDFEKKDITIYTKINDLPSIDLLILAVKGYHLDQVIPQVEKIVERTGAFVLPLLNGIEHLEKLQKAVGKEKVLGGFASIIATLNAQGHIVHSNASGVAKFGTLHSDQIEVCKELEEIGRHAKTNIIREEDILKHMWNKYIFITAFSGITSAMQLPAGFITNSDATLSTAQNVIQEMCTLAEKEGIHLTEKEVEKRKMSLTKFSGESTSSMHQDMRKGLPLEVEHIHGGALRIAEKHQIRIPVIETLYGILKPYENGKPN